jgi:protein TonB
MFIALSVAVHAWALMLLPGDTRETSRNAQVQALEVVLLKPELPPVMLSPSPPAAEPTALRPQSARKPVVIAQPQPKIIPQPEFTSPSPAVMEAPPAPVPAASPQPAAPVMEFRALPTEAKVKTSAVEPLVAPSFNATYLRNPPPRYPLIARRNGEQGTVTLRVLVSREGLPASVDIERTSGFPPLDHAAREAVRSWRFAPARRGAQAVEAWVLVPIVFRLEDA